MTVFLSTLLFLSFVEGSEAGQYCFCESMKKRIPPEIVSVRKYSEECGEAM